MFVLYSLQEENHSTLPQNKLANLEDAFTKIHFGNQSKKAVSLSFHVDYGRSVTVQRHTVEIGKCDLRTDRLTY